MKYNLAILPLAEFENFNAAVQSCFDLGQQRYKATVVQVTTEYLHCPEAHHQYLQKENPLAMAMNGPGRPDDIHIWVSPAYRRKTFKFYMTLAHELVHGYAGLQYGHAAHWRRWFYRVIWHLNKMGFIPKPQDELAMICWSVEFTYNRTGANMMGTVLEAFAKAEEEHEQVVANYWERLNATSRNRV